MLIKPCTHPTLDNIPYIIHAYTKRNRKTKDRLSPESIVFSRPRFAGYYMYIYIIETDAPLGNHLPNAEGPQCISIRETDDEREEATK